MSEISRKPQERGLTETILESILDEPETALRLRHEHPGERFVVPALEAGSSLSSCLAVGRNSRVGIHAERIGGGALT